MTNGSHTRNMYYGSAQNLIQPASINRHNPANNPNTISYNSSTNFYNNYGMNDIGKNQAALLYGSQMPNQQSYARLNTMHGHKKKPYKKQ